MATPTSSYTQWASQARERAQGMTKTKTRQPRNHETVYGLVLSSFHVPAKGQSKPKQRLTAQLGALAHDPAAKPHPTTGKPARRFDVDSKGKSIAENKVPADQLVAETWLQAYDVLEFSVDEETYVDAGSPGTGDVVELHGITFSNWFSKETSHVSVFCNGDRLAVVPGATRGGYARDIWLALGRPLERLRLEEAPAYAANGGEDANVARLGKSIYALNAFGSDAAAAERYIAQSEHELVLFDTVPEKDPENPKVDIVTYTPDVYNKAAGGFTLENGFQAPGIVDQHFAAGAPQSSRVLGCKVRQEHLAPLGMTSAWPVVGPILMPQLAFTLLVKQNLEKTANEVPSGGGNDEDAPAAFVMVASVQGMLVNVPAQLERLALVVPPERLAELVPAGETDIPGAAGELVIPLNGGKAADLAELVRRDKYAFYVLTSADFNGESLAVLEDEPADKRYLLFDKNFRDALNKAKGQAAKGEVLKRYGLEETSNLPALGIMAGNAAYQLYYAVLKPERRVHDCLDRPMFRDALASLVPDPEAVLGALKGDAGKRKAGDAPVDVPEPKEARVEAEPAQQ